MDRRNFLKTTGITLAGLIAAGLALPAVASTQEPVVLNAKDWTFQHEPPAPNWASIDRTGWPRWKTQTPADSTAFDRFMPPGEERILGGT